MCLAVVIIATFGISIGYHVSFSTMGIVVIFLSWNLIQLILILHFLGKLVNGIEPSQLEHLQRNVAMHAALWPGCLASAAAWQRAQRGPRLGVPRPGPV